MITNQVALTTTNQDAIDHDLFSRMQEAKSGRGIILTTHSMEEATALCDRVGICVGGKLVCVGHPRELNARFGGYLVFTIAVPPQQVCRAVLIFVRTLACADVRLWPATSTAPTCGSLVW